MDESNADVQRRTLLQLSAGLAAAQAGLEPALAGPAGIEPARTAATAPAPTGRPGDFEFLSGEWKIRNRRLKDGAWDSFDGEATVFGLLAGVASVEELRIPARQFSGMGLRLLDVERRLWADFWVNARSGVLVPPPSWGSFVNGVGIWDSQDDDDLSAPIYRGAWDQITPTGCRWTQALSNDGGKTWQEQWVMHWTRR